MSFKPCYKWNAFNTESIQLFTYLFNEVLNLVISGMPSIQIEADFMQLQISCFKPCYKWNAFNT